MRITITTDTMSYTDSIEKIASDNNRGDNNKSQGNLSSIAGFQKLLGHEMEKRAPSKVPVGTSGIRIDDTDTYSGKKISAPDSLKGIFHEAGEKYNVDERLLIAIAYHESRFETDVTSSSGAMGVMQLMPGTAKEQGVEDAYDPEQNIMGAAKLVSYLLNTYDGDVTLAMAAYSDGMGAVKRAGGVPDTKQAKEFVSYINSVYPNGIEL